jgi:3-dehydroquinate synthase
MEEIILSCGNYKNEVVARDFCEKGERIFLNLGHSLGHAFELSLKIPHGQAVAMGLKYIFKIMRDEKSLTLWTEMVKLLDLPLEKFDLKKFQDFDVEKFLNYLENDKKKIQSSIRLVLVNEVGSAYLKEVPLKELKEKIMENADFKD